MNGVIGIHAVEALARRTTCPHIIDGPKCYGKECILWKYAVPMPELDANGDVTMIGEGWVCGFDESRHLVANAQTKE